MRSKLTPFEQALLDASLEEFADIPEEEDAIDIPISPGFAAKARKLIRNTQRKTWRYTNTTAKRIILVAAIVALLATTAMAVPVIREAVIRFFVHDEGTHYEFTFDPETLSGAPQEIETVYMPTYIPEGYTEIYRDYSVAGVNGAWQKDGDFNYFSYAQILIPKYPEDGSWLGIDAEEVSAQYVVMNGYEVFRVEDNDIVCLAWTDYHYFYLLTMTTALTAEVNQIFDSIQEIPDAVIQPLR